MQELPKGLILKVANFAGIKTKRMGSNIMGECPDCERGQKSPNTSYSKEKNTFHCFSCGAKGGVRDLCKLKGLDFRQLLLDENIIQDSVSNYKKKEGNKNYSKSLNLEALTSEIIQNKTKKYLDSRGINPNNVMRYIRELKDGAIPYTVEYGYNLAVPAFDVNGVAKYLKLRNIAGREPKVKNLTGYAPVAIGLDEVPDMNMCVIVEGEIDYLVAKSIGFYNVIAMPTIMYNFHKEELDALPENIYLLVDNDDKGKKNMPRLAKQIYSPKNPKRNVYIAKYPKDVKDLADLHKKNSYDGNVTMKDLDDILQGAITNRYTPFKTSGSLVNIVLDDIAGKIEEAKEQGLERPEVKTISTGLPDLDELLDGGLRSGLYGVAGRPAIGKTSFLLALAKKIVESKENDGTCIIFFSLEMTSEELVTYLLSWLTGISKYKIQDRNIDENGLGILRTAFKDNAELFNRIIIEDKERTVDGMRKLTVDVMNEFEKKCVVMIDYLQQIELKQKYDLRIAMKEIAYELKDFANSYEIPVFFISSTQREQYKSDNKNDLLAAFKESGDIEYSLYVGIFLDKLDEEEMRNVRIRDFEIPFKMVLVKNRHGRCRDRHGKYLYLKLKLSFSNGDLINLEEY